MRLVNLSLDIKGVVDSFGSFFNETQARFALVIFDGVHCLLLHGVELVWNQVSFSNLKITFLIQCPGIHTFLPTCFFEVILFVTFISVLAWGPVELAWSSSYLVDEFIVAEMEMGFTNLKTTLLADIICHGSSCMLREVLLCNGLVIRLVVSIRELLHFVLQHSFLLLCQLIARVKRLQPIFQKLVTEVIVICRCVLNTT